MLQVRSAEQKTGCGAESGRSVSRLEMLMETCESAGLHLPKRSKGWVLRLPLSSSRSISSLRVSASEEEVSSANCPSRLEQAERTNEIVSRLAAFRTFVM